MEEQLRGQYTHVCSPPEGVDSLYSPT